MKKIVLMSNRPWYYINYLNKLCETTGCQMEAVLCSEHVKNSGPLFWYDERFYQNIKQNLNTKNIVHHNNEKCHELAEKYVEDKNVIILAEFEHEEDPIFHFIKEHKDAQNIICMAKQESSIHLFHETFDETKELMIPNHGIDYQLSFDDHGCQFIKSKLK